MLSFLSSYSTKTETYENMHCVRVVLLKHTHAHSRTNSLTVAETRRREKVTYKGSKEVDVLKTHSEFY